MNLRVPVGAILTALARCGPAHSQRAIQGKAGTEKIQATAKIADGGTLAMRGPRTKYARGGTRDTLVIATINLVSAESK